MTAQRSSVAAPEVGAPELGLYGLTILLWSTSFIAMTFQLGTVDIVVSVFYRFVIASSIMVAWVFLSGRQVRFPLRLHARFALMGVFMFSSNFALYYFAVQWVTSGLLAVVFSLVTILNPINAAIFLRQPFEPRVIVAAMIGVAGVALIFSPEIAELGEAAVAGLALAIAGSLSFSLGNITAFSVQREGHPVVSSNAWGMVYGALFMALLALLTGAPFAWDPSPSYAVSLAILGVLNTAVAFAGYLTLMRRIGPSRAGYATVMFPIGALAVSWAFEDYRLSALAVLGLMLALFGNLLVLRRGR